MCKAHFISCFANSCNLIKFLKQYLNIFLRNFVLCIQIRFVSTEKNYAHRLACILLYKKSLSPYIHVCELSSNRACCIRLSTSVGYIYIFNVYMPCDSTTNANLDDYNDVLSVISHFCATHNVR